MEIHFFFTCPNCKSEDCEIEQWEHQQTMHTDTMYVCSDCGEGVIFVPLTIQQYVLAKTVDEKITNGQVSHD